MRKQACCSASAWRRCRRCRTARGKPLRNPRCCPISPNCTSSCARSRRHGARAASMRASLPPMRAPSRIGWTARSDPTANWSNWSGCQSPRRRARICRPSRRSRWTNCRRASPRGSAMTCPRRSTACCTGNSCGRSYNQREATMRRTTFVSALTLALGVAIGVVGQQNANAQTSDSRVADLIRAGKVRVGVGVVAPHWAVKDSQTGELRGVAVDIARALATRLKIELVAVEYPSPPAVLGGLKDNAWDVGFLAIDPSRATVVDFSPPYLQIDATYLVPDGSSIRNVTDADQPGVRVAVTSKSVEEIVLSRSLKRAELRSVDTISAGFDLLRANNADVLAAPRPALLPLSSRLPGSRVLADRFHAAFGAMAVPKGQTGRLAYIAEFIEEAKASGLVQRAIERAGVRGVQVAPPGNLGTQ